MKKQKNYARQISQSPIRASVYDMTSAWEEIHGFDSPSEYERFCVFIGTQIKMGAANKIATNPVYNKGQIAGAQWLQNFETKEIWRLFPPNFPFKGLWEKVDIHSDQFNGAGSSA